MFHGENFCGNSLNSRTLLYKNKMATGNTPNYDRMEYASLAVIHSQRIAELKIYGQLTTGKAGRNIETTLPTDKQRLIPRLRGLDVAISGAKLLKRLNRGKEVGAA
jgi:hypothetical protein